MSVVLSLWQGHCKSSLGSFDECRLSTKRLPTIRPSHLTWAVSPPVGCHHLHHLLLLLDTHDTIDNKITSILSKNKVVHF